jgi:DNA-binding response OmpR family regulator
MKNRFLKELKVLLVEDEDRLSQLFKSAIGDSFQKFYIASNGEDGIQKYKKLNPDIIITDIMMPKRSGLEMAKEIRKTDKNIPIIILSAYSETDKLLNAIDIGVVKYFIKPYDPDELLEYINSIEDMFKNRIVQLVDNYSFNKSTKNLYKNGRYIALSQKESKLFDLLVQNSNKVVHYEEIKKSVWDENVSDDSLRTFIRRTRDKTSKSLLKNVKSQGYKIETAQE